MIVAERVHFAINGTAVENFERRFHCFCAINVNPSVRDSADNCLRLHHLFDHIIQFRARIAVYFLGFVVAQIVIGVVHDIVCRDNSVLVFYGRVDGTKQNELSRLNIKIFEFAHRCHVIHCVLAEFHIRRYGNSENITEIATDPILWCIKTAQCIHMFGASGTCADNPNDERDQ